MSGIVQLSGASRTRSHSVSANMVAVDMSSTYPEGAMELPKIGFSETSTRRRSWRWADRRDQRRGSWSPAVLDQVRAAGMPVVILANDVDRRSLNLVRGVGQALGVPGLLTPSPGTSRPPSTRLRRWSPVLKSAAGRVPLPARSETQLLARINTK